MNPLSLAGLIVRSVDAVWSIADDFAPFVSLKEAAMLMREARQACFDNQFTEQETALNARLHALRQAHAVLATRLDRGETNAFAQSATQAAKTKVESRLRTLLAIADPTPRGSDPLAGTVLTVPGESPLVPFRRVAEHATPAVAIRDQALRLAEDMFGSRELRDIAVTRRARAEERMRLLGELDDQLATATAVEGDGGVVHQAAATVMSRHQDAARSAAEVLSQRRIQRGEDYPPPASAAARPLSEPPLGGAPGGPGGLLSLNLRIGRRRINID